MTAAQTPTVLVGVSPSPSGREALRRAVQEAQRRGARLHLLRVWSDADRFASMSVAELAALRAQERAEMAILSDAAGIAQELAPELDIIFEFAPGDLHSTVTAAARDAELLVVGAGSPDSADAHWSSDTVPCPLLIADAPMPVVADPALAASG